MACQRDLRACQRDLRACQTGLKACQEAWGDGQTDIQTDGQNFSPFYRALSSVGATGQKVKKMAKLKLVLFGIFCCFEALRGAHETSDAPPKECD